jgi:hypothetical protein
MPANSRFLLYVATTIALIAMAGCGGGASLSFPAPQGTFTNASLTGPFAFSYTGSDGGFLAVAGSFQADGAGHITAGTQDINSGLGIVTNTPVTGTYTVRADGRGSITLNSTATGTSTLDFVLVANGHALVIRFDASATGSGTIDQQTTSAFSNAALAGSFAFSLAGIDQVNAPLGVAGNFTSDASGNITTGIDDSNDNSNIILDDTTLTGSIPVAATGRGVATINTIRGTFVFAFYVVDSTHLKLVETDATFALGGEAFRQTGPFSNASFSGPFAFTVAGVDQLSGGVPFAGGGVLTSNGAGIITTGTSDFNDAGTVLTSVGLTGSYVMAANGRGTLALNTASAGNLTFVIYPTSAGVLALETDVQLLTNGSFLQQQTTAFSNATFSGGYGLNFTASPSAGGEIDAIAQFTASGTSVSGIIDLNNSGSITFGQPLSGTFAVAANGRTTLPLVTPLGTQNLVIYMVDGTRALFIETDTNVVAAGDIRHQ